MAGDMNVQVVVRLRDELSRGLDAVLGKIRAWGAKVGQLFKSLGSALGDLASKFGALAGVGAGMGLMGGLESFTKYDAKLRDIAITYGLVGKAVDDYVTRTGKATEAMARQTGQVSQQLLEARGILAAANVDAKAADVMIGPIGKTATAAGAGIDDIARTAVAAFQNSGLKDDQLGPALAHMVTGGKLGSFELKDMAKHYPQILAALANLGVKGMEGIDTATAMLQISKRTAGTPGEAATNMQDFLSGVNSSHTVKRFEDKGINLSGLIADANARGINPVEAVVQKIGTIINQPKVVEDALKRAKIKGLDPNRTQEEVRSAVDQAVKAAGLGELFVNQQSKMFLMAMLANTKDYLDMKGQIRGADGSVIDQDFAARMAGPEGKQRMAQESVEQLMRRLGGSLQDLIGWVDSAATSVQGWVAALDGVSPKIVDFGVKIAAAISLVSGALLAGRMFGLGRTAVPAVAAAAGVGAAEAAVAGGAAATAAGGTGTGLLGGLLRFGGGAALGATVGYQIGDKILKPIAEVAGGKYWTPKTADGMQDLRDQLAEVETRMQRLTATSKNPDMLDSLLTGDRNMAADLRNRIAAGEGRLGAAGPGQKVEVGGSITIKVEGPGKIVDSSSVNPAVPIGGDRGANGGRP